MSGATPVRAVMRPGVVTLAADTSLLQAQRAMIAYGVHAVLTVGADGPVGWITAGGLLPWLGPPRANAPAQGVVSEIDLVPIATGA